MSKHVILTNKEYLEKFSVPLYSILNKELKFFNCNNTMLKDLAKYLSLFAVDRLIFKLWFDNNFNKDIIDKHLNGNADKLSEFYRDISLKHNIPFKNSVSYYPLTSLKYSAEYMHKVNAPYLWTMSLDYTDVYLQAVKRSKLITHILFGGTENYRYPLKQFEKLNYILMRVNTLANNTIRRHKQEEIYITKILDINLMTTLYYKLFIHYITYLHEHSDATKNSYIKKNILYNLRGCFGKNLNIEEIVHKLSNDCQNFCVNNAIDNGNSVDLYKVVGNYYRGNKLYQNFETINNPDNDALFKKLEVIKDIKFGMNRKDFISISRSVYNINPDELLQALLACGILKDINTTTSISDNIYIPSQEYIINANDNNEKIIEEVYEEQTLPKITQKLGCSWYYVISDKIMNTNATNNENIKYQCIIANKNGYETYSKEFNSAVVIGDIFIFVDNNNDIIINSKGIKFSRETLYDIMRSFVTTTDKSKEIIINGVVMFDNNGHHYTSNFFKER